MFLPVPPSSLITKIIDEIKNAHTTLTPFVNVEFEYNEKKYNLFNMLSKTLKGACLQLSDEKKFVSDLIDIAPDIIIHSLNVDSNMKDCWDIFNIAYTNTGTVYETHNSLITHIGKKMDKNWKRYALYRLDTISTIINEFEINSHSLNPLPYTNVDSKHIKLLHAKDIIILFKLIRRKYPDITLNTSMCFRYDDLDISMKSILIIKKEMQEAYDFLFDETLHIKI